MQRLTNAAQVLSRVQALSDEARGRRVILGVAGTPGSGKSTLAQWIAAQFEYALWVPMDGYHLADVELIRQGKIERKGAIDTFDGAGYLSLLSRIKNETGDVVFAPTFDRDIEQPIAGGIAIEPEVRLVVTEGNYLLFDDGPWGRVRGLLDETWFSDIGPDERRKRLVQRHIQFGKDPDAARQWVEDVDWPNALAIEQTKAKADLLIPGDIQLP